MLLSFHLPIKSVIPEDHLRTLKASTSGLFTYPNPSDAGGDASVVCRFSAPVDVSNERSHPSSSPSIKRLLPRQSFTRRLISVKSMRLLVPALWLQTPTSLSGAAHGSAPLPLPLLLFLPFSPFMSPFSSLPRRLGVFVFSPLSFKSRQVGANSLAVFPLLFFPLHFLVFRVWLLSLCFPVAPLLLFSKLSWEKALINHFEGVKSALLPFFLFFFYYQQTRSLVDLADCRYPPQRPRLRFRPFIRPQMQTGTRTQAPKHIQRPNSAKVFKAIWWMCGAALSVIPHLTLPSKTKKV